MVSLVCGLLTDMAREYALLLLLAALAPSAAQVIVRPSEIRNARLGCTYRLVCQIANLNSPLVWLRGGTRVTNATNEIRVTEREVSFNGTPTRRTELEFSPLTVDQLGTYQCFERDTFSSYNGRIEAPEDSLPINIVVAGAPVKNISLSREGEQRDVGCTVESCLQSQYTVRFRSPSGVVVRTSTSTSMMMTFNWQAQITSGLAGGNYTCEVQWDQGGMTDTAVFQFAGTPMPGPTRENPTLPCPTPGRAWSTPISMMICVASFLLAVWLR